MLEYRIPPIKNAQLTPLAQDYARTQKLLIKGKSMLLGKVTGSLWSTRKDEKLNGWKFMMVDILNQEEQKQGFIIAADNAGAGIGDKVLISQGNAARISAENPEVPIDAMIVGVIDAAEEE